MPDNARLDLSRNPFLQPAGAALGDTFPLWHDGVCHLFVLQPPDIAHLTSRDLVHWEVRPTALGPGAPGAPDEGGLCTGCVVEHQGRFFMFYTGPQNICLATSDDLDHWTRHPGNPVATADGSRYTHGYFRDPFVFRNEAEGCWWMLVGSNVPGRPSPRAGCVGLAKSPDLLHWELQDPLWAPGIGPHHDCPQLIHHAGRWTLLYLQRNTRCRVASSPSGPFRRPPIRDLGAMYAAAASRPAFDGTRWVTFPFACGLADERDLGAWSYGGPLVVPRELVIHRDGSLTDRPVSEVLAAIHQRDPLLDPMASAVPVIGQWETRPSGTALCRTPSGGTLRLGNVPGSLYLEVEVTLPTREMEAHLILRAADDLTAGYKLSLHPGVGLVDVRPISIIDIDRALVSRPMELPVGEPIRLRVFLCGSVLDAFIGETGSITTRVYERRQGALFLESRDAAAQWRNLRLWELYPDA